MVNAARILTNAARDVVKTIDNRYGGYDAELVRTLARVLQILRDEPGQAAQRRAIETLVRGLASEVNSRTESS